MRNPYLNRTHLQEYFFFGLAAAIVYIIPVLFFLYNNTYQNLLLPFVGNILFMFVIFYYAFRLLFRPYDKKRTAVMLIAGHMATLSGVVISLVLVSILTLIVYPRFFHTQAPDALIEGVPANAEVKRPIGLLLMLLLNTLVGNFGAGSAISVITAYAGKLNQTKDKPAELHKNIPRREAH